MPFTFEEMSFLYDLFDGLSQDDVIRVLSGLHEYLIEFDDGIRDLMDSTLSMLMSMSDDEYAFESEGFPYWGV